MCGIKYKITTLAIYSSGVRRIEECVIKSTNFGQSQWHMGDLSTQQGGEGSDQEKWTMSLFNKRPQPAIRLIMWWFLLSNPTTMGPPSGE